MENSVLLLLTTLVAGGKKAITFKLVQEITLADMGFEAIWTTYQGLLTDPIMKEELLSRQFLLDKFDLDNKRMTSVSVISRLGLSTY